MSNDDDLTELAAVDLDVLLSSAHDGLLHHLSQHTDPTQGLLILMNDLPIPCESISAAHAKHARAMIELRNLCRTVTADRTRELCEAMVHTDLRDAQIRYSAFLLSTTHVLTTVLDLTGVLSRARNHAADHAFDFARAEDLIHTLDRDLTRTRVGALGLPQHLDPGLGHNLARARKLTHTLELPLDLDRCPDPIQAFALLYARTRDLAFGLAHDLARLDLAHDLAFDLDRNRDLAVDRARGQARSLSLTLAGAVGRLLASVPVDVSGMDMSRLRVTDPEVFAGVVWTRTTTWSEDMRELVEARSGEIMPGVFQVRSGNERDPQRSEVP